MLIEGTEYSLLRGSDVERDGMFLELHDVPIPNGAPIAEYFYSDVDGTFSLNLFVQHVPEEALDWLRSEGRRLLPPVVDGA